MMRGHRFSPFSFVSILVLIFGLLSTVAAAQVVSNDFEDGTTQGWIPRGPVTLTNSTTVANTGTHSLLTTGRTAGFNGPSLNLVSTLTAGQLYIFKVSVRMQAGQAADTLKMTMQSTPNGGSSTFATVATSATNGVTDSAWVTLTGTFTPASNLSGLLLYVEAANATSSYYIDSFSITASNGGCAVPPDNSGFSSDFESGLQGWASRTGVETVAVTNADAHSGSFSLLTTGRTANFRGPSHDATGKMCNGSQYEVIAWVKMAPGQPSTQIRVSVQLTLAGVQSFKTVVGNTNVTPDAWVRLKVKPYTFSGAYDNLQIYVESNNNPTASFYIDDFSLKYMPPPVIENIPSVAQAYSQDFLVGFASVPSDLSGPHSQLAALHFNSVTPGNDLKWDTTEASEGNFNFTPGDNLLNWAQSHNVKMRGHTFVWHSQVPNWVFVNNGVDMSTQPFSEANKQLLLTRMKNHINALINHYKDNIYVWDVVNEAVDDSGIYRQSKWYTITVDPNNNPGYPEYIDDAFIYARQALDALGIGRDKVKLCYNDYNTTIANKRSKIYEYVSGAIRRGVPIDCVGHQFHNNIGFPIDSTGSAASKQNVIDTINMFAALKSTADVPIVNEVTEFDMSLYSYGQCSQKFYFDYDDILAQDQADLIAEGYRYRDYFQIFKGLHDKIDSVTLWGASDDESWLNPFTNTAGCNGIRANDAPLLFDSYLQHKYAYTGVMSPLDLPGADLETTISADPNNVLSGHALSYTITVTNHGHNDASNVVLTDSLPAGTVFQSLNNPGWSCTTPAVGSTGNLRCTSASLGNGASAQFTLTVLVACQAANGASISNTAGVTSDTLDPNTAPNNSASVSVTVSNPPPAISGLTANPTVLWSPNHKMVDVSLAYQVTDNCDASIVPTIAIVNSDAANGTGDGNTATDTQVLDATHVQLRAERSATSETDRVYTITLTATDSQGYASSGAVNVTVPSSPAQ